MGSRNLTGGAGFRPAFAGRRDLVTFLDQLSHATADNFYAVYKAPLGGGAHLAVKECDPDTPFVVGSAIPGLSFTPGQTIILGSNSGQPGDVINGAPPPGRGGGSRFGQTVIRRTVNLTILPPVPPEPPPPPCPLPITGKTYIGITGSPISTLRAWLYADGVPGALIGPSVGLDFTWSFGSSGGFDMQRVHSLGDVVIFKARKSSRHWLVTWDCVAGTLATIDLGLDNCSTPIWPGTGTDAYFQQYDGATLRLYKVAIGATGTLNLTTALVGNPLTQSGLTVPRHLFVTGTDFQVPALLAGAVVIPSLSPDVSLDWLLGTGRQTVAGATDLGVSNVSASLRAMNGYRIAGDRAARATVGYSTPTTYAATVGIMPVAPASPETPLVNIAWDLRDVSYCYPSPDETELVLYDVIFQTDPLGSQFKFARISAMQTYEDDCVLPRIEALATANGRPNRMLPRD